MSLPGAAVAAALAFIVWAAPVRAADAAAPAAEPAVAIGAEIATDGARTRLTLTLSRPVAASAFLLEAPDRVVVELPEVNFQLGPDGGRRGGLVASYRGGTFAPGRSRFVVDLAAPASVAELAVVDGPMPGVTLMRLDLVRADREAFRRAVAADRQDLVLTTGSLPTAGARDARPLIAVDAGHGGVDPGARAPGGALEKDITFAFAEMLRDRLADGGRYRILMIRDHDVFVPLDERVRRAREAGADLLLSIHADSIASPHVSGATIYTGAERASDGEAASLAERENAADAVGGAAAPALPPGIADILQDLTLRETRAVSSGFSRLLLRDLGPALRLSSHPRREAGFRVLRSHDLPAVLVELGYLSNLRDLELMLSPDWRRRMAGVMAGSIDRFFAGRPAVRAALSP